MNTVEDRLAQLGLEVPKVPRPVAEYIPAKKVDNLIFCSGQGPIREGKPVYVGKVGADRTLGEGYEAAKLCALNCLAAVKSVIGDLNKVEEIVKVRGFVNSAPDFERHPEIINGASELLVKIFGEKGKHARTAIGTSVLPGNITVELEMIVKVRD